MSVPGGSRLVVLELLEFFFDVSVVCMPALRNGSGLYVCVISGLMVGGPRTPPRTSLEGDACGKGQWIQ